MAGQTKSDDAEEDRQRIADRVLGLLEDAVYWAIAVVLVVCSVALLIAQFNTMLRLRNTPASTVMIEILDGLLLIFIFVELLYAVRSCLRSHEIVAEPFLIVGILAGIKEIVVLSVEAATLLHKGPDFCGQSWRSVCWAGWFWCWRWPRSFYASGVATPKTRSPPSCSDFSTARHFSMPPLANRSTTEWPSAIETTESMAWPPNRFW